MVVEEQRKGYIEGVWAGVKGADCSVAKGYKEKRV